MCHGLMYANALMTAGDRGLWEWMLTGEKKKINEARKTAIAENMAILGAKWLIFKPQEHGNIIPRLLPVTKCSRNARWPPRKESCLGRVRLQENSLLTNRIFPYYQKKKKNSVLMGRSEGAEIQHGEAKGRELKTGRPVRSAHTSMCHQCHHERHFPVGGLWRWHLLARFSSMRCDFSIWPIF